eukprot:g1927.t1
MEHQFDRSLPYTTVPTCFDCAGPNWPATVKATVKVVDGNVFSGPPATTSMKRQKSKEPVAAGPAPGTWQPESVTQQLRQIRINQGTINENIGTIVENQAALFAGMSQLLKDMRSLLRHVNMGDPDEVRKQQKYS